MTRVSLSFLPAENWRILKQINLISAGTNGNLFSVGIIIYERPFSPHYKMKEISNEEKDFTYYLNYPKQEIFPSDDVDRIILNGVRSLYPNSIVVNDIICSSIDLEKIGYIQNRPSQEAHMTLSPDFSNIYPNINERYDCLKIAFKVYTNFSSRHLQSLFFIGRYGLDKPGILDKVEKVVFL